MLGQCFESQCGQFPNTSNYTWIQTQDIARSEKRYGYWKWDDFIIPAWKLKIEDTPFPRLASYISLIHFYTTCVQVVSPTVFTSLCSTILKKKLLQLLRHICRSRCELLRLDRTYQSDSPQRETRTKLHPLHDLPDATSHTQFKFCRSEMTVHRGKTKSHIRKEPRGTPIPEGTSIPVIQESPTSTPDTIIVIIHRNTNECLRCLSINNAVQSWTISLLGN